MRIRKKEQSVGVVAKVLNSVNRNSNKDTYSCGYIQNFIDFFLDEVQDNCINKSDIKYINVSDYKGVLLFRKNGPESDNYRMAIEWGTVSVTSSADTTITTPFNVYSGSTNISFRYEYVYKPVVITFIGNSFYNYLNVYSVNTTTTGTTVGARLLTPSSTRDVKYVVIGQINDSQERE